MQASCHTHRVHWSIRPTLPALISACIFVAACSGKATGFGSPSRGAGGSGARSAANAGAAAPGTSSTGTTAPTSNGFVVGNGQGAAGRASTGPTANGSQPPTSGPKGPSDSCASGMQSTSPVTPTVWLVVDGSSSMSSDFEGNGSRWLVLRSTLMDTGGVVDSLQDKVKFGLVIYAGGDPNNCVQLVTVQPALNNLAQLSAQYPMNPVAQGTPTDKALEYVVNNLPVLNTGTLDATSGPIYVVLATDGQPNDNCGAGAGGGGLPLGGGGVSVEQQVIDVTEQGTQNGMQMFVVSLAGDDTRLQSHLELVAAATASKTPPYVPSTRGDLIAAFESVIGGASCLVSLDGNVEQGAECTGSVRLNGVALPCKQADGWSLFDPSTVQLTGTACNMFLQQTSMVMADFPCEAFSPN